MGIGYSGAPRVTQNNMESRLRRLSRSLKGGNNGTPIRATLLGGANTNLIEEFNFEAAPGAANTSARRPVWNVYSTQYRTSDNTSVVNAGVIAGSWNTCGFLEVRCHTDNTLVWGVNNTFGGGPGAVVYMGSAGYMKADNTAFFYDEGADTLSLYRNTANTSPSINIEEDGLGDAMLRFQLTGGQQWTIGIDNSDNDSFKIQADSVLGADTDNVTILTNATVGIGTSTPVVSGTRGIEISSGTPVLRIATTSAGGRAYAEYANSAGVQFLTGFHDSHQRFKIIPGTSMASNTGLTLNPTGEARLYRNDTGTTPQLKLEQDSTGDATINFLLSSTFGWVIGIDNSDGDRFKIQPANTVGANTGIVMNTTGKVGINCRPNADLHVKNASTGCNFIIDGLSTSASSFRFDENGPTITGAQIQWRGTGLVGTDPNTLYIQTRVADGQIMFRTADNTLAMTIDNTQRTTIYDNSTSTTPKLRVEQDGTGDAAMNFLLTSTIGWSMGIDNSDSDQFKISAGNTVEASTVWWIKGGGDSGIGTSPDVRFHVADGTLKAWAPIQGTSTIIESTDANRNFVSIVGRDQCEIHLSDNTAQLAGRIRYDHTNTAPTMSLYVENAQKFVVNTNAAALFGSLVSPFLGSCLNIEGANSGIRIKATASTGWGYMLFVDELNASQAIFGYRDGDNSVRLSPNASLDDTTNSVIYNTTTGYLGLGKAPTARLHAYRDDTGTEPLAKFEQDGTGDATINFILSATQGYTIGIDNSVSDILRICAGNTATANGIAVSTAGHLGFGQIPIAAVHSLFLPEATTETTFSSTKIWMPRKSVNLAQTNIHIGCQISANSLSYDIATGITDSGNREAFRVESFVNNGNFEGTLAKQIGGYFRTGHSAGTGTISNSIGVLIEQVSSGSVTVTQGYGVYQSSSGVDNYFAGNTGFGKTVPTANVHTYRNDTAITPSAIIEQDSTGDAALSFLLSGTQGYTLGIDNSDSDRFKICIGNTIADNTFVISGGRIGIGTNSPIGPLEVSSAVTRTLSLDFTGSGGFVWESYAHGGSEKWWYRSDTADSDFGLYGLGIGQIVWESNYTTGNTSFFYTLRRYSNDTSTTPGVLIEQDSTGDAAMQFLLTSVQGYVMGVDNSDSDRFRIHPGNTLAASTYGIHMTTAGRVGIGDQTSDGNWLYVVPDSETSTGTRASVKAELPKRAVNANESNFYFGFHSEWQSGTFDIGAGFTDSGSREGFRCEAFVNDSTFQGTLATQKGLSVRTGHASSASNASAIITNSIGVFIENLASGAVTVTNAWGLYQTTSTVDNFFAGDVRIGGSGAPDTQLHVYENSGDTTTAAVFVEQDGSGDAAVRFSLTGVRNYTMGIDNSDSDAFKISQGTGLGTNDVLIISAGNDMGVGNTIPSAGTRLLVTDNGASDSGCLVHIKNNSGGSNGGAALLLDRSANYRNAQVQFGTNGTPDWYCGILRDGGGAESGFAISNNSDMNSDEPEIYVQNGKVTINDSNVTFDGAFNVANGPIGTEIETVTVNTTLSVTLHSTLLVDCNGANKVITLPAASAATNCTFKVKKVDSGVQTVTIDGNGAETIDGAANTVLSSQYDGVVLQSDGTTWWIIART